MHPGSESDLMFAVLRELQAAPENCPKGKKGVFLKPLKGFFADVGFLHSLSPAAGGTDPLSQDWDWVRRPMKALLRVVEEFNQAFAEAKRELGAVDFPDLEQHALRLLWDKAGNVPTATARTWRDQLRFVFVDEYQDINAAQDRIIQSLSRDGQGSNRFLVGDIKQSIYRFRLANPEIFQSYIREAHPAQVSRDAHAESPQGSFQTIHLSDNFRARESILYFVNSVFSHLMHQDLGGVEYDKTAHLKFGAPEDRLSVSLAGNPAPAVELRLRVRPGKLGAGQDGEPGAVDLEELENAELEARSVGLRLLELRSKGFQIWDQTERTMRPARWNDMAILLRSRSGKAEAFAKEFARLNIPLLVSRGGFYQSLEVMDILSLLQLLDNPLQDIPCLAVLHSPLVGLTVGELAEIRQASKGRFWFALKRWREINGSRPRSGPGAETLEKADRFLQRFDRWRRLARQVSLSRCIETVLEETLYAAWLLTQPRGEHRYANLQRLLRLAQRFDTFQRQSLFRFLRFVEAQQLAQTEPEVGAVSDQDSVRLMSIHQSKGLEFPIVVAPDLSKPFNTSDLHEDLILDEVYGLCPLVRPPHSATGYPSLPLWLGRRRQRRELLGEELRLLYVAATRARDRLILCATITEKRRASLWAGKTETIPSRLSRARSYADWLENWFAPHFSPMAEDQRAGANEFLSWELVAEEDLSVSPAEPVGLAGEDVPPGDDPIFWSALQARIGKPYAFRTATLRPAKTSVSALRRRIAADLSIEGAPSFERSRRKGSPASKSAEKIRIDATEIGSAHHLFLQHLNLTRSGSLQDLQSELRRMIERGIFSQELAGTLDLGAIGGFWSSKTGKQIREKETFVQRELPFTARFTAAELDVFAGREPDPTLANEILIVQGIVDLAVILPKEIWVVDFKTDAVRKNELKAKVQLYAPQLRLYSEALIKVYRRPVSCAWLHFLMSSESVPVPLSSQRWLIPGLEASPAL
jgi:ATP-dependent helicase/nuclease subunit A